MNVHSPAVYCAESGVLPVLRVRKMLIGLAALLVTCTFIAGPAALRAQSGEAQSDEAQSGESAITDISADEAAPADINAKTTPSFVISPVSMSLAGEHTTGAAAIPTTSKGGYAGTVELTCTLETKTSTPTPPECIMYPSSINVKANGSAQPQLLIFGKGTKLPPGVSSSGPAPWLGFGSAGTVLACTAFFGIPARRRRWKAALPAFLLLIAISGMTACSDTPKMITAGQYTFKVSGADSKVASMKSSATIKVRVL
jgi:hypothetical protein